MSNDIVVINASEITPGAPNNLQQSGALVTQGGTTLAAGTLQLVTSLSALQAILAPGLALASLTWSGSITASAGTYNSVTGLVTLTLSGPTLLVPGASVTVSGAAGTGSYASLNGTFTAGAATTGTTLTYTIATGLTMTITGATTTIPGQANATTTAPHGWVVNDVLPVTVSGCAPTAYNGTFLATITGASTLIYPLATNPGAETTLGKAALGASNELLQMGTTYFAQTTNVVPVYVLELGDGTVNAGVTALSAWITANPKTLYSYLIPREWDNNATFLTLLGTFTAVNAFTYFFVTTTVANRAVYAGLKCVLAFVEAPTIGATEFSLAAVFSVTLNYQPSSASQITQLAYSFLFAVTAYPLSGNGTVLAELRAANVGWVGTGAEGGLSNTLCYLGKMSDGNSFNFWYSGDWAQLQMKQALANEIIIGSNSQPPLNYNQPGIDRLQNRAAKVLGQAISSGLANGQLVTTKLPQATFNANVQSGLYTGQIVLNADPFASYTAENPDDYANQVYKGLTGLYIPLLGFIQAFFQLEITDLITG